MPDQMQPAFRARAGDVEQPHGLVFRFRAVQARHIPAYAVLFTPRRDGRHQQLTAVGSLAVYPDQKLRVVLLRLAAEARNNNGVELQAFGFVDRH